MEVFNYFLKYDHEKNKINLDHKDIVSSHNYCTSTSVKMMMLLVM